MIARNNKYKTKLLLVYSDGISNSNSNSLNTKCDILKPIPTHDALAANPTSPKTHTSLNLPPPPSSPPPATIQSHGGSVSPPLSRREPVASGFRVWGALGFAWVLGFVTLKLMTNPNYPGELSKCITGLYFFGGGGGLNFSPEDGVKGQPGEVLGSSGHLRMVRDHLGTRSARLHVWLRAEGLRG